MNKQHRPVYEHLTDRVMQRFASYVIPDPNTGCWLWSGAAYGAGYGQISISGFLVATHRVALAHKLGRDLRGQALHSCDVPLCVNPDHLREGTAVENMRDRSARGRWRCGVGYKKPRATGSLHHDAKLTEADVVLIRSLSGTVTEMELGRRFGVARSLIGQVVRRERWKHL